jgi:hypothetical protein
MGGPVPNAIVVEEGMATAQSRAGSAQRKNIQHLCLLSLHFLLIIHPSKHLNLEGKKAQVCVCVGGL